MRPAQSRAFQLFSVVFVFGEFACCSNLTNSFLVEIKIRKETIEPISMIKKNANINSAKLTDSRTIEAKLKIGEERPSRMTLSFYA